MSILPFKRDGDDGGPDRAGFAHLLDGFSIEVMPRTAARVEDFRAILPPGTRIYVAHIEGTPIEDMVATAARLRAEDFPTMVHVPARAVRDRAELDDWLGRYRDAGVEEALVLAGGGKEIAGALDSSIALLETGLFERHGFTRLHVAGHPEGNRDIDPSGGHDNVTAALRWKQGYADQSTATFAVVTQFAFDAGGMLDWADGLRQGGIRMPVHAGIAGPAKLQTLLKFAIACGVGPSLGVLQKRARDVTRLLKPYTPDDVLAGLAKGRAAGRGANVEQVHIFPLGGIATAADYATQIREGRG